MVNNWHAVIINLSQLDINIFRNFNIINIKKRFFGIVQLYKITVPEEDIKEAISSIQANMSSKLKKEWYATFYNPEKAIIVFRNKKFELSTNGITPVYQQRLNTTNADDKKHWDEMIRYAKSLNIPDSQLDFLPPGFRTESYQQVPIKER